MGAAAPRAETQLLVALNVDVDGQHGHGLGQDEGERTEVEGPAVVILALLVFFTLVAGVAGVAGYVDDDADDVAETCRAERKRGEVKGLPCNCSPHLLICS